MLAIATNACPYDYEIISYTLPSWLRVFGKGLGQVQVIVDERRPEGEIAGRHALVEARAGKLWATLIKLSRQDSRVTVKDLVDLPLDLYSHTWFGRRAPVRCQAGSPILPFVAAFEATDAEFVLRTDCDMLFSESGWLREAERMLGNEELHAVAPPRLGVVQMGAEISSRALMIKPQTFRRACLPVRAAHLGVFRGMHRCLHRRSTWLALEQILDAERRRGRIRHAVLDNALGFSVHVNERNFAPDGRFGGAVRAIESGRVTRAQLLLGWNFSSGAWAELRRADDSGDSLATDMCCPA